MMSNPSFFKMLKEDLRHKVWMAALSCLAHFLMILVAWLIWRGNMMKSYGSTEEVLSRGGNAVLEVAQALLTFFGDFLPVAGGSLAIPGAIITGMFGFRFLFHANMVDLYHALPVKRNTLYGVCWLNGILIWFVPFAVCTGTVVLMGCGMAAQLSAGLESQGIMLEMLREVGRAVAVVAVIYLLIYHLVLTSVMLTGNLLNALISMLILGFGTIAAYGLGVSYFDAYMETFYGAFWSREVVYTSPLFSALVLLNTEFGMTNAGEVWICILQNLAVGLGLGVCAWLLYQRRPSETAQQGIGIPAVAACFRVFLGTAGGMCGWVLFVLLVSDVRALSWGIFGAVLTAVCACGILDMIFQMDVRAFFSHKLQMAAATGLALFLCFLFYWDWMGYDTYLPDREEIAEIAVYDGYLTNSYFSYGISDNSILENMHFQEKDVLYPYLERMVENEADEIGEEYDRVATKVTLNNGRSYYRYYRATRKDREVVWPILSSEEYLKYAYLIEEGCECRDFQLQTDGEIFYGKEGEDAAVPAILSAYNQDLRENPESVMLGDGKVLASLSVNLMFENEWSFVHKEIAADVYGSMEHTVEALRKAGYEVPGSNETEVAAFVLMLEGGENVPAQERIVLAGERYGVGGYCDEKEEIGEPLREESREGAQMITESPVGSKAVVITDREEVKELTALTSFRWPSRNTSVFGSDYVDIIIRKNNGTEQTGYLPRGALPEKYLLRFGEGF